MKSTLLLSTLFTTFSYSAMAQNNSSCYAITGKDNNNFFWADIKLVDMATGKIIKTVFETNKTSFKISNAANNTLAEQRSINAPTGNGVAACAFDAVHNRLYFSPLYLSDIHYLDLNKADANFTTIKTKAIASSVNDGNVLEENQITRMVIGADGYGYALTNDANHLIRFSTDKNPVVEDIGSLIDAAANKEISIHNKCSSWGGDMVADAFGKLVIVAATHNVFIVDIDTKTATLKGAISGLPVDFTTNGAAVNNDGSIVVSSANVFEGLYKVNMKDLSATKIVSVENPFNASDLANGNFLYQKEADAAKNFPLAKSSLAVTTNGNAKIFPNPVSGSQFRVLLGNQKAGQYTVQVTDLAGRAIQSTITTITNSTKTTTINLANQLTKGVYLVNLLNDNNQIAFTEKIVIE